MRRGAETGTQIREESQEVKRHLCHTGTWEAEAGGLDFKVNVRSGLFSKEHFCSKFFFPIKGVPRPCAFGP